MRKTMLLAACCFICVSQTGLATPKELLVVKLSKADTTHDQFVVDRNDCLTVANRAPYAGGPVPGGWAKHHLKVFGECMGAKGYKSDANGFLAIRYSQDGRTDHVFVEAL